MSEKLEELTSDAIAERAALAGSAAAIRFALLQSPEVQRIARALRQETLNQKDVDDFVASVSMNFVRGSISIYDIALAALCVSLELAAAEFSAEYLSQISALRVAELPQAPRVAAICAKEMAERNKHRRSSEPAFIHTGEFEIPTKAFAIALIGKYLTAEFRGGTKTAVERVAKAVAAGRPGTMRMNTPSFEQRERLEVRIREKTMRKALENQ